MVKEYTLQEALKLAIKTEKESMDFYQKAGSITTDERSKKVFDLLANEEIGHLKAFFDHYKGGDLGDLPGWKSPSRRKSPASNSTRSWSRTSSTLWCGGCSRQSSRKPRGTTT